MRKIASFPNVKRSNFILFSQYHPIHTHSSLCLPEKHISLQGNDSLPSAVSLLRKWAFPPAAAQGSPPSPVRQTPATSHTGITRPQSQHNLTLPWVTFQVCISAQRITQVWELGFDASSFSLFKTGLKIWGSGFYVVIEKGSIPQRFVPLYSLPHLQQWQLHQGWGSIIYATYSLPKKFENEQKQEENQKIILKQEEMEINSFELMWYDN